MRKLMKGNAVMTLIEILIVVGLIGTMFVFLVPRFLDYNQRELARSEARSLSDGIKKTFEYATGGVQVESSHTLFYQFSLYHDARDQLGVYRGYEISSLNEDKSVQTERVDQQIFSCQVCITADDDSINFRVPTGRIEDVSNVPVTYSVCYPGQGTYTVSLEASGAVTLEGFSANACACNLGGC